MVFPQLTYDYILNKEKVVQELLFKSILCNFLLGLILPTDFLIGADLLCSGLN